jgi:hypothetical protein
MSRMTQISSVWRDRVAQVIVYVLELGGRAGIWNRSNNCVALKTDRMSAHAYTEAIMTAADPEN